MTNQMGDMKPQRVVEPAMVRMVENVAFLQAVMM